MTDFLWLARDVTAPNKTGFRWVCAKILTSLAGTALAFLAWFGCCCQSICVLYALPAAFMRSSMALPN